MFDSLDSRYLDETAKPMSLHEALERAHRERSRTAHGFITALRRALF
ncbi:hypothetical protein [Pontivivens ytuae]|uniref:Uncharacterized protein n=1 Tax=Pontivivens ytuae TaxID=2789856 RepID=A0A7S9QBF9_9RHOB|nr:hypothetical protein [Pontivivens ytuae]QPH52838.1 hypothetical protein I0K15_13605 [Pontivivens ytuae]